MVDCHEDRAERSQAASMRLRYLRPLGIIRREDNRDWRRHADTLQSVWCESKRELTELLKIAGRSF